MKSAYENSICSIIGHQLQSVMYQSYEKQSTLYNNDERKHFHSFDEEIVLKTDANKCYHLIHSREFGQDGIDVLSSCHSRFEDHEAEFIEMSQHPHWVDFIGETIIDVKQGWFSSNTPVADMYAPCVQLFFSN